jgi:hypothetical protein
MLPLANTSLMFPLVPTPTFAVVAVIVFAYVLITAKEEYRNMLHTMWSRVSCCVQKQRSVTSSGKVVADDFVSTDVTSADTISTQLGVIDVSRDDGGQV